MAKTVEDLQVFHRALAGAAAISALLRRPSFQQDRDLASQLNRASTRIVANIAEGFAQKTDRHFAKYLFDSRGGADEVQAQLRIAADRRYLSDEERTRISGMFAEICRMLTGLMRHLQHDDWRDRRR